jgi:mono/diheme cytochrome c family protein
MSNLALIAVAALKLTLTADPAAGTDERDAGPDKIDVSAYPAEQKARYSLFQQKCSKCHSVARAVNSRFTPPEWKRYIKRMVRRPNAGVTDDQADEIFEFLKFYSQQLGL